MIGYIATIFTTSSVLPGLYKAWKTKSAGDLSLIQLWCLQIGIALWLCFAISSNISSMMIANSLSLLFNGALIALRYRYGRK